MRRRDALGMEGQAEIVVGAGENGAPAVDDALGRRDDALDLHAEGIDAERREVAPRGRQFPEFVEESHHRFPRQVFDLQREILHGLHVREDVHRNRDVESILDVEQQIHHLQRIQVEVAQEVGVFADFDAALRERRQLRAELGEDLRIFQHDIPGHAVFSFRVP